MKALLTLVLVSVSSFAHGLTIEISNESNNVVKAVGKGVQTMDGTYLSLTGHLQSGDAHMDATNISCEGGFGPTLSICSFYNDNGGCQGVYVFAFSNLRACQDAEVAVINGSSPSFVLNGNLVALKK